ncbi:MAG: hypothetical protein ABSF37_03370 [Sedimentisphaerales bacterium]
MRKSSVGRATEKRPIQKARGIKDTARRDTRDSKPVGGRSSFLACLVSLGPLQPTEPGFNSPHVQLLTSAIL